MSAPFATIAFCDGAAAPRHVVNAGVTIFEIVNTAAEVWDIDARDLVGRMTHRVFSEPRQAAATVAVEHGFTSNSIGRAFSNRTSEFAALAALRSGILEHENPEYADKIAELRKLLVGEYYAIGNPYRDARLSVKRLMKSVARDFAMSPAMLLSKLRKSPFPAARSVVYKLLQEEGLSLAGIGRSLDRDHSTVMHALERFERYRLENSIVSRSYERHCAMREEARGERG